MTEYNFIESPFPGANGPFENAPGLQPTTPDRGGRPRGEVRLPWSFPVRLGGSRGGGLPDQRPLAQFPLWPSLFASMRFMGPGEYRRPRERALRVPSVSVVPLAIPTRSRASWAQTTRRQCRSSTAGFYSPYRTRGERKSGDLPRLPVGVGAFGSPFAKHTRGNKRRRGAGEGFCDPTHRDPRPA